MKLQHFEKVDEKDIFLNFHQWVWLGLQKPANKPHINKSFNFFYLQMYFGT